MPESSTISLSVPVLDSNAALSGEAGWNEQCLQWRSVIQAGVIPKSTNTPEACIAIAKFGGEVFGFSAIESVMKICIVEGKMTLFAEVLMGLMSKYAVSHSEILRPTERSSERAAILVKRASYDEPFEFEYTQQDATTAGLWGATSRKSGKPLPWSLHPKAMLWARVVSVVSRAAYPDVTGGAYVSEEFPTARVMVTQLEDETPLETALGEEPEAELK